MRLSSPEILVDINHIEELKGIKEGRKALEIGALTRHVELLHSPLVAEHTPLIALAMPHIAHAAIRNRGTIGGSLSLADPAAELPACTLALEGSITLNSSGGERQVAAEDYFLGLYETARRDDEVLSRIVLPKQGKGSVSSFQELSRRAGDFAIVGLAATAELSGGLFSKKKSLGDFRLVFFGCESKPTLALTAGATLQGGDLNGRLIEQAKTQLNVDLSPSANLEGRADTKLHQAKVLLGRACEELLQQAAAL